MTKAVALEGTSMSPLFKTGGIVFVEESDISGIHRGDCVVYDYEGRLLLHRVYEIRENILILADDAGVAAPHAVDFEQVRGKALDDSVFSRGFIGFIYGRALRFLRILSQKFRRQKNDCGSDKL